MNNYKFNNKNNINNQLLLANIVISNYNLEYIRNINILVVKLYNI
jgi:hypothetical protein